MPKDFAVLHGEGAGKYFDEQSSPIGMVLASRNLGNSQIGPEYLLHFPNGRKSWVPQRLCEAFEAESNLNFLADNGLALSEDSLSLVFMSDPEDEEVESDPSGSTPEDTGNDSDASGEEGNEEQSEENAQEGEDGQEDTEQDEDSSS